MNAGGKARRWARWAVASLAMLVHSIVSPNVASGTLWPSTIERLAQDLGSSDVVVQRSAAALLGDLPPSALRRLLPSLLVVADPEVRVAAGRAAMRIGFDAAREAEGWLQDSDPQVRRTAAELLGTLGVPVTAITALARTLSDPVAAVRLEAAKALSNAPAVEATRVLLNHLDDPQEPFVLAVVDALSILGEPSAVVPLVGKVQDQRVNVRRAVVRALGEFDSPERMAVPLVLALSDSDPEVRRLAADSIVAAGAVQAAAALEERARRDRDVDVQAVVLSALLDLQARVTDPATRGRAFQLAIEFLSHERQELRSVALEQLSQHSSLAREPLRECLGTRAGEVVGACAVALAHDGSADNVPQLVAAWRQGRLATNDLLTALAETSGDQALLVVLELLGAPESPHRQRAVEVAARLLDTRGGDGRAVEPIVEALRRAAGVDEVEPLLDLLGRTRSLRAVPRLLSYVEPSAPTTVTSAAVTALGRIPGANVPANVVERLLTHADGRVRSAAALAVRDGEWPAALAPLTTLLSRATFDESRGLALALWGPARHLRDAALVQRLVSLTEAADERVQAPLVEAMARIDWSLTAPTWRRWANSPRCSLSAKVAEVLESFRAGADLAIELTRHACSTTRANAAWSLGAFSEPAAASALRLLVGAEDRAISGNAVASLGRIAARAGSSAAPFACPLVELAAEGGQAHRSANALFALRATRTRCGDGSEERRLLAFHGRPEVRRQVAQLLASVPAPDAVLDRLALERCLRKDADGEVASACSLALQLLDDAGTSEQRSPRPPVAVSIMVVPPTRTQPVAGAPFTLRTEQGAYRFGQTDARGGVWAWSQAPDELNLGLPVGIW